MVQAVNCSLKCSRSSAAVDGHINTALCELSQPVSQVTALLSGVDHVRCTKLLDQLQSAVHNVNTDNLLDLQMDGSHKGRNADAPKAKDNNARALRGLGRLQHRPGPGLKSAPQRRVER